MADGSAPPPAVEPEQRHEVDGRQRRARDGVEVCAVRGVEPQRLHRPGEQRRVHAVGPATAVLVRLDLQQGCLRPARQPRDGPRVRVRLLEVVGGAVHDEFEELLARRSPRQVPG